jgi:hypothetical protein
MENKTYNQEEIDNLIKGLIYPSESEETVSIFTSPEAELVTISAFHQITWEEFLTPVCSFVEEDDLESKKMCNQFWQLKYWFDNHFESSKIYKGFHNPIPIYIVGLNQGNFAFTLLTHSVET